MTKGKGLAEQHLGIIVKVAAMHWRRLPPQIIASYDLEDMVSDAVMHVIEKTYEYKRSRARESTFVWRVASNYCAMVVAKYHAGKRCADLVLGEDTLAAITKPDDGVRYAESRSAVERVLESASEGLQAYLDEFIRTRSDYRYVFREPDPALMDELRKYVARYQVTRRDFETVLRSV